MRAPPITNDPPVGKTLARASSCMEQCNRTISVMEGGMETACLMLVPCRVIVLTTVNNLTTVVRSVALDLHHLNDSALGTAMLGTKEWGRAGLE